MGIKNFCKLLKPYASKKPDYFDSILIDLQSYLYIAIEYTFELEGPAFLSAVCDSVWHHLDKQLRSLLHFEFPKVPDLMTLVLCLDGEGVPMKWPTQRNRRNKLSEDHKSFYRHVLFGNNIISLHVKDFILERMKHFTLFWGSQCRVIVSGSEHWGEGEHKLFQIAQKVTCHHPLVVSVDQDVFILALLRLHHFETIQIHRYDDFYSLSRWVREHLSYPLNRFITVSILFGNDFIPPLLEISQSNTAKIHEMLAMDTPLEDPPVILATFLDHMRPHMRWTPVECVDLIKEFWLTYLWILDYYTHREFLQLYMQNTLYDRFDRNQLLTGLIDEAYSTERYREALSEYQRLRTEAVADSASFVFMNETFLKRLEPYWIKPESASTCSMLLLTKKESPASP